MATEERVPRILIGVPILAWTHEFATSFLRFWTDLMTYQHKGRKFEVSFSFQYRVPVHMAEEALVQLALDTDCTHILLMDDDILDVTVDDFLKLLDADKDVVGGIMHAGGFPFAICAFRRFDTDIPVADMPIMKGTQRLYMVPADQREGLQPVDLIAFAFCMFKTKIFKELKKPWFKCDSQAPTDSWFSDRLLEAKLEYFAHFDVWLNHKGITRHNVAAKAQVAQIDAQVSNKMNMIVLSPEEMQRQEAMMSIRLEEAEKKRTENAINAVKFYEKSEAESIGKPINHKEDENAKCKSSD